MHFLNRQEMNLIESDARKIFKSIEATPVTLHYSVYSTTGAPNSPDPVYPDVNSRSVNPITQTKNVNCMQKVVSERDYMVLRFGFLEVGDCMFYFPLDIDFTNISGTENVVENSIVIQDPAGIRWQPKKVDLEGIGHQLGYMVDDTQLAQFVPAILEKN